MKEEQAAGRRPVPQPPGSGDVDSTQRQSREGEGSRHGRRVVQPSSAVQNSGHQPQPPREKDVTVALTHRESASKVEVASGSVTARAPSAKSQQQVQKYHDVQNGSGNPGGGSNIPLTPAAALKLYMNQMTLYEQGEILDYPQVYFVGCTANKTRPTADATNNYGYDDERGDYTIVFHDHLSYRYEILGILGKGSFGVVAKCYDWKTNQLIALKVIRNKKRFHHQALVEVKILEHLRDNWTDSDGSSTIVFMSEYFYFRNHMCISFELLCINLYEFIKNNKFQGLSLGLIRRFALQLLVSLRFLRKFRVIHCDLKPENILLKAPNKSSIKVIDFGSSCFEDERVYTYIQSRFYRSPEVILGLPYDTGIDMWSFGCILAELYTGYPLFPGENEVEQLACIMEVLGLPPRHLVDAATRRKMFFDSNLNPRIVPNSRGKKRRPGSKDVMSAIRCSDPLFVNFLEGCLRWDKALRLTPEQALQHEWITEASVPPPTYRHTPTETSSARASGSTSHRGAPPPTKDKPAADDKKRGGNVRNYLTLTFRDRLLFPPIDPFVPKSSRQAAAGAGSSKATRPSPR
eukprot:CAMPEP_0114552250 /NCGR_PEP_ID=MMETSP0114-20121206/7027_1 /TAXON_ID=31324 /ORGANISM="Goniomonas sp, Strain m" /LENGTH=575 /DNA_ID=CAMNT_0001737119 /DNA_START=284 /DNA_END=2011 /DNA_ORIENTATION=-